MSASHTSRNLFLAGPSGKLEAVLWTPVHGTPRFATVVCHPHPLFGGTLHNKVVYQAAKALDGQHGVVLRFNFRGTGLSEGKHDYGQGEQGDVASALDYLATEFAGLPLVLAGFSFGCWVGLRVGCKDPRVKRLIGIGTPVNNSDFSFLEKCSKPKLFVHGEKDEFGDVHRLTKLVETLPGEKQIVVVEGVDHFLKGRVEELGKAIAQWMSGWPVNKGSAYGKS